MTLDRQALSEESRRTAAFYDASAGKYDSQVDGSNDNVALRQAFCRRVSALTGEGGTILDFGCGTGADAAWYAARGHRVVAYDVSKGMIGALHTRCASEVANGTVVPIAGDVGQLEAALARVGIISTVAANFAVLNHVRDLRPLLELFARHLAPHGALVASILNPFYRHDMTRAWWWKGALRSLTTGSIRFCGGVTTYRHFERTIRRVSAAQFAFDAHAASALTSSRVPDSRAWRGAMFSENFLIVMLRKAP